MTNQRGDCTASSMFGIRSVVSLFLFAIPLAGSMAAQDAGKSEPGNPPRPGTVELEHSRVYALVGKVGLGHEHGVVGRLKSGNITWTSKSQTGNLGSLVFDMTSFNADTPEARKYVGLEGTTDESTMSQVYANMRSSQVLDVQRHPEAIFALKEIELVDPAADTEGKVKGVLRGDFTLHGVTRPVEVQTLVDQVNGWWHLRGAFRIRQTDFGIQPYTKLLGAIGVADVLTIYGDLYIAP
jgi:polyisoprenoid-binding protein YceI